MKKSTSRFSEFADFEKITVLFYDHFNAYPLIFYFKYSNASMNSPRPLPGHCIWTHGGHRGPLAQAPMGALRSTFVESYVRFVSQTQREICSCSLCY